MAGKNKVSWSKSIINLVMGVPMLLRIVSNFLSLVDEEARLAGRSLITLLILFILLGGLLTSTWLCFMALLCVYFVSLSLSWPLSLLIVFIINILLLMSVLLGMIHMKKNLSFPKTRNLLKHINYD